MPGALHGIRVLDFSTLLPGPMCTLLLAEAGAEVIKIERPDRGDEMRSYTPRFGSDSVNFALLNRGKRSIALDLKDASARDRLMGLVKTSDVVVEQFRAGVMERLGLGYDALSAINPGLVYCSITGYGQAGPLADVAAHDINYLAETGMLGLTADRDGAPPLPQALIADLAGGTYPALFNIVLALRQRDVTGRGSYIDVAMADSLFTLMYWGLGNGFSAGQWPVPAGDLVTGGSPRYQVYRTADGRYLAAAPLEQKFWENFVAVLGAPELLDDQADPQGARRTVARIIAEHTAAEWETRFAGVDSCVNVVRTLQEAVQHPHFVGRGLFSRRVDDGDGRQIPALPVALQDSLRTDSVATGYPKLGQDKELIE
jgi:alpha-methylacyl-CoA racemase